MHPSLQHSTSAAPVMLSSQATDMFACTRGLTSRVCRRARWGCGLATATCAPKQTSRLSYPPVYTPCGNTLLLKSLHHSYTTCAAVQTRDSPAALDPGDYEAGQIQVYRHQVFVGKKASSHHVKSSWTCMCQGSGGSGPCTEAAWNVYRQHWTAGFEPHGATA